MSLETLWFIIVAVLWVGYLVLEGFDFGVGILSPFVGRDEEERETILESIGPFWDGNEVWLISAGGATFAAFPQWYATMFSGYYIALLLILLLLIVRVLAIEWRGRTESSRWKSIARRTVFGTSALLPVLWGVALSSLLSGVPIDGDQEFAGSFWDLFTPFTVLAGVAVGAACALHGATFLGLRLKGVLRERVQRVAAAISIPTALAVVALMVVTVLNGSDAGSDRLGPGIAIAAVGGLAVLSAIPLTRARRERAAFAATALAIGLWIACLFALLYPNVMVSSLGADLSLTIDNASSASYTLTVMTVVAAVLMPIVLMYQGWSYYVLRARLGEDESPSSPGELLDRAGKR